jgi:ketosteroid isomerase-like protein
LDVKSLGPNAAREIGTFSFKTKAPSPQEVTGKYVVVWEKVGNDWKLSSDIWNE